MRSKIDILRSLVFSALICLKIWDVFLLLMNPAYRMPETHREFFLVGFLLWVVSVMAIRDRDDDWAGQI